MPDVAPLSHSGLALWTDILIPSVFNCSYSHLTMLCAFKRAGGNVILQEPNWGGGWGEGTMSCSYSG